MVIIKFSKQPQVFFAVVLAGAVALSRGEGETF